MNEPLHLVSEDPTPPPIAANIICDIIANCDPQRLADALATTNPTVAANLYHYLSYWHNNGRLS